MANSIETQGDISVGRNASVGGKMVVQGNATVNHNLNIKGWLDAPNIKGANKGIFGSTAALNTAYPTPGSGWYAGVLTGEGAQRHIELYIESSGQWTDSGHEMKFSTDLSALDDFLDDIEALEDGKADKVGGATADNLAALDSNGNLKDSGKKKSLFDILGIQTGFFFGKLESGTEVIDEKCPDAIDPINFTEYIYLDRESEPQRFVCYNRADEKYYTRWNDDGETAYMEDGKIRQNKLFFDSQGDIYFSLDGWYLERYENIKKADKVSGATNNNFAALNSFGNLKDSGKKATDFALASHTHSGYIPTVSGATTGNIAILNAYGNIEESGINAQDLAVAAAVDSVELTVEVPADGEYRLNSTSFNNLWSVLSLVVVDYNYNKVITQTTAPNMKVSLAAGVRHNIKYVFKQGKNIPGSFFRDMDGNNGTMAIIAASIPSYVTILGDSVFANCSKLMFVICHALTPPYMSPNANAFSGIYSGAILYRHAVAASLYGAANSPWNTVFPVANSQQKDTMADYTF